MICAKNYETVSKFVKVMTTILWPLFFRTRCICLEILHPLQNRGWQRVPRALDFIWYV